MRRKQDGRTEGTPCWLRESYRFYTVSVPSAQCSPSAVHLQYGKLNKSEYSTALQTDNIQCTSNFVMLKLSSAYPVYVQGISIEKLASALY